MQALFKEFEEILTNNFDFNNMGHVNAFIKVNIFVYFLEIKIQKNNFSSRVTCEYSKRKSVRLIK